MCYDIESHKHLFAAWAASRAASVAKGSRFSVETGRSILELAGFGAGFSDPDQLPATGEIDREHRQWRNLIINKANELHGISFTHGVAAKLINVYLKCRFVCGGYHEHQRVCALHPPIDAGMLKSLAKSAKFGREWRRDWKKGWSNFDSARYEGVIARVRLFLKEGEPLWTIEKCWKGNQ